MNTWDLGKLYHAESWQNDWWDDFEQVKSACVSNRQHEIGHIHARLWAFAYANYALDCRNEIWTELVKSVSDLDDLLSNSSGGSRFELGIFDQWASKMDSLQEVRIDGLTRFQALSSPYVKLRRKAVATMVSALSPDFEDLAQLAHLQSKADAQSQNESKSLALAFESANRWLAKRKDRLHKLVQCLAESSDKRKFSSAEISLISENHTWVKQCTPHDAVNLFARTLSGFYKPWSEHIQNLALEGSFNFWGLEPNRLQAAFSLALGGGMAPLCFTHSGIGRESILGIIHECAHGLHFSSYRNTESSYLLPQDEFLEIFPLLMELIVIREWEGQRAYEKRVLSLTSWQSIALEFRRLLALESSVSAANASELWVQTLRNILGSAYSPGPNEEFSWAWNKQVFNDWESSALYPIGGVRAAQLAECLYSPMRNSCLEAIAKALQCPPYEADMSWKTAMEMCHD